MFVYSCDLTSKLTKQKYVFLKKQIIDCDNLIASYEVCLKLVKQKKGFRDGKLLKRCAIKMANAFGNKEMASKFETVSLFHQTVSRRVNEMSDHVTGMFRNIIQNCKYYSLALDESNDISDNSQLIIFIRTIDKDFNIHEELLQIKPLITGTRGVRQRPSRFYTTAGECHNLKSPDRN